MWLFVFLLSNTPCCNAVCSLWIAVVTIASVAIIINAILVSNFVTHQSQKETSHHYTLYIYYNIFICSQTSPHLNHWWVGYILLMHITSPFVLVHSLSFLLSISHHLSKPHNKTLLLSLSSSQRSTSSNRITILVVMCLHFTFALSQCLFLQ